MKFETAWAKLWGFQSEASRFHTHASGERAGEDAEARGEKVGGRGMMNYQRIVERERMLRHVMAPRQQSILSRLIGGVAPVDDSHKEDLWHKPFAKCYDVGG
jgi:hypothetical protein